MTEVTYTARRQHTWCPPTSWRSWCRGGKCEGTSAGCSSSSGWRTPARREEQRRPQQFQLFILNFTDTVSKRLKRYAPCPWAPGPWRRRTTSRLWPSGGRRQWRNVSFIEYLIWEEYFYVNYVPLVACEGAHLSKTPAYPHCQGAVAVVHRLTEEAVVREPGCDHELGNMNTITSWNETNTSAYILKQKLGCLWLIRYPYYY